MKSEAQPSKTSFSVPQIFLPTVCKTKCLCGKQVFYTLQWWIQDFPEGCTNSRGGYANLLFYNIFAKHCIKMKEFGPGGHVSLALPLDPPLLLHLCEKLFSKRICTFGWYLATVSAHWWSCKRQLMYCFYIMQMIYHVSTMLTNQPLWFLVFKSRCWLC